MGDYSHEFIELRLLRRALAAPNAIDASLAELGRYSLVALSERNLRVHPLLQTVVRDSARLRPWHYYYRIWRLLSGFSDKEAWKAALWPRRAAHLLDISRDRDSHVWAHRPYAPHIEAVLSHLPETLFQGFIVRTKLIATLRSYREYSEAASALRTVLAPATEGCVGLLAETDWLFAHLDDFYEKTANIDPDSTWRWLSLRDRDSKSALSTAYDFLRFLSRGLAKAGETTAARRLFRFRFDHAAQTSALPVERARIRIEEAVALAAATPVEETQLLLEEGITLFEQCKRLMSFDVIDAVWLYATEAQIPEQRVRAVGWLRKALPVAQRALTHGVPHACYAAVQLVRLLREAGQMDEALAICEETLRVGIRSRAFRRGRAAAYLAPLWQQRGSMLRELGRCLAAARSYARCLALERRDEQPAPLRVVGLLSDAGEMFRRAGCLEIAESRLLEAAALLDKEWADNPHFAEILASLLGVRLRPIERPIEGEALLRRSIASRRARLGSEHAALASSHRLLGVFLHEAERFSEAETEFRRALELSLKDPQPDNPNLLPALDSLATLLEDLQRHAEALPLRQRYLALTERNKGAR